MIQNISMTSAVFVGLLGKEKKKRIYRWLFVVYGPHFNFCGPPFLFMFYIVLLTPITSRVVLW